MARSFSPDTAGTLSTGLVGYWPLDANADDVKGTAHGAVTGATLAAAKIGNGYSYDATTEKILLGSSSSLNFERTDSFSISGWFKINSIGANRFLLGKQLSSGTFRGWVLWQQAGDNKFNFSLISTPASSELEVLTPAFTNTTGLHHIVVTYAGTSLASGIKIYIDNVSQSLTTAISNLAATILNAATPELGNRNGVFNFNGLLDEMGVWSKVLSTTEISDLYNAGAGNAYIEQIQNYTLALGAGAFSFTGTPASVIFDGLVKLDPAGYSMVGSPMAFPRGYPTFPLEGGVFSMTGSPLASVFGNGRMQLGAGSFVVTGNPLALSYSWYRGASSMNYQFAKQRRNF